MRTTENYNNFCFHLGKLDVYVEQATRKVANYLGDVLEDQREKLLENLVSWGAGIHQYYIIKARFSMSRFHFSRIVQILNCFI